MNKEIKLHTIATFQGKEYELEELLNGLLKENQKLKEKIENLTTLVVCGDTKQIKNTAQYKLEQLQQRIEEVLEDIKDYKEMGYSKYDENEIEIELIDKILEKLGGENNR